MTAKTDPGLGGGSANPESETLLPARIRQCAEIAGSGDELARRTGIPRRTLENYLSGKSEPKARALAAIARAVEVSLDWLVAGEPPMRRPRASRDQAAPQGDETPPALPSRETSGILFDPSVLSRVVAILEIELAARTVEVSPEKKGELVALVYEYVVSSGGSVDRKRVQRMIALVA